MKLRKSMSRKPPDPSVQPQPQPAAANTEPTRRDMLDQEHNVQHVALLLPDGEGKRRAVLVGPNNWDYLENISRRHLPLYGKG